MNFTRKAAKRGGRDRQIIAHRIGYVHNGCLEHGQRLRYSPSLAGLSLQTIVTIATEATRRSQRVGSYTEHWVAAFTPDEYASITEETERECVERLVTTLGYDPSTTAYVWGWHLEDGHPHLHVVVIRTDPVSGLAGGTRQPIRDAEREAVLIAADYDFQPLLGRNNRQALADLTGQPLQQLPPSPLRSDVDWASGRDDRAHKASWTTKRFNDVRAALEGAQTWSQLHSNLAQRGLRAERRQRGHLRGTTDTGVTLDRPLYGLYVREGYSAKGQRPAGAALAAFKTSYVREVARLGPYQEPRIALAIQARLISERWQVAERGRRSSAKGTISKPTRGEDAVETRARALFAADRDAHNQRRAEVIRQARLRAEEQRQRLQAEKQAWLAGAAKLPAIPPLRSALRSAVLVEAKRCEANIRERLADARRLPVYPAYALQRDVYRSRAAEQLQAEAAAAERAKAAQSVAGRDRRRRTQEPARPTFVHSVPAGPLSAHLDREAARARRQGKALTPSSRAVTDAWYEFRPALDPPPSEEDARTRPRAFAPWARAVAWELLDREAARRSRKAGGVDPLAPYGWRREHRSPEQAASDARHAPAKVDLDAWLLVRSLEPSVADRAVERVCCRAAAGVPIRFKEALRDAEAPRATDEARLRALREADENHQRLRLVRLQMGRWREPPSAPVTQQVQPVTTASLPTRAEARTPVPSTPGHSPPSVGQPTTHDRKAR